jgi:hypothetical protein
MDWANAHLWNDRKKPDQSRDHPNPLGQSAVGSGFSGRISARERPFTTFLQRSPLN